MDINSISQATSNWVTFYEELSLKILQYKDNSKELFDIIKELILRNPNLEYLKLDTNDFIHDPFSIIAILNRPISSEIRETPGDRLKLAIAMAELFQMKCTVPTDFTMIPKIDSVRPIFNGNVECWKLFELAYNCGNSSSFTTEFYNAFDNAIAVKGNSFANITLAMSWVRPNAYLILTSTVRDFLIDNDLETVLDIFPDLEQNSVSETAKIPSSLQYTSMCNHCQSLIKDAKYPYNNFAEMMYFIINQDDSAKNFWWLNISPQTWNFVDTEIGERKVFDLVNEQGSQRRIHHNFLDTQRFDMVMVYEANPIKKVIGLAKVVKPYKANSSDECIVFEKIEELTSPISYDILKEYRQLDGMEFFQHPHGSLFKLSALEYDFILNLNYQEVQQDTVEEFDEHLFEKKIPKYNKNNFLSEVFMTSEYYDSISATLRYKKNIVLQGVSGVGKTYLAKKLAYSLMGEMDNKRVEMTQFHQQYSYEHFIFDHKTVETGVKLVKGVFYEFCKRAQADPNHNYFFIIDELHRGNIDNIFGETFMLLENDKRSSEYAIKLINRTNENFYVPANVHIIGLVNTCVALSLFDLSFRRRFSFIDIEPAFETPQFVHYQQYVNNGKYNRLILMIKEFNYAIKHPKPNFNDPIHDHDHDHHDHHHADEPSCLQIGHGYFVPTDIRVITDAWLENLVQFELVPLIREYWYDDAGFAEEWCIKLINAVK